jgi:hypothetical protein
MGDGAQGWREYQARYPLEDGLVWVERHICYFGGSPDQVCEAIRSASEGMTDAHVNAEPYYEESAVITVCGYVTPTAQHLATAENIRLRTERAEREKYEELRAKYEGQRDNG